jgi:DNA polymerase I
MNPLNQQSCFIEDTDVLTPDGIRNIRELSIGDTVYSIDTNTFEVQVDTVTATHEYPDYDDDVIHFQGDYIDFIVMPINRLLVNEYQKENDEYSFIQADEIHKSQNHQLIDEWSIPDGKTLDTLDLSNHFDDYEVLVDHSVHGRTFTSKISCEPESAYSTKWNVTSGYKLSAREFEADKQTILEYSDRVFIHDDINHGWVPLRYDGDDVVELLAWYVSEGCCNTVKQSNTIKDRVVITKYNSSNPRQVDSIRTLLESMNLPHSYDGTDFQINDSLWNKLISRWCGDGSETKQLPNWVFHLDYQQRQLLFDVLIAGDGTDLGSSYLHKTVSNQLREDMLQLSLLLDYNPLSNLRRRKDGSHRQDVWRTRCADTLNTLTSSERRSIDDMNLSKSLRSITIEDNNPICAGRNGKFQWI